MCLKFSYNKQPKVLINIDVWWYLGCYKVKFFNHILLGYSCTIHRDIIALKISSSWEIVKPKLVTSFLLIFLDMVQRYIAIYCSQCTITAPTNASIWVWAHKTSLTPPVDCCACTKPFSRATVTIFTIFEFVTCGLFIQ
jgi:hypothetical protein